MNNDPLVTIQYLVDYELSFTNENEVLTMSEQNPLANLKNINVEPLPLNGKKGLHLCGGSVDEDTNEVSGCLLDGTYTFYKEREKSYSGIMGNSLSNNEYRFEENQYVEFKTLNDNNYIKSLFVYFDPVSAEFAKDISFSNGINADGTQNEKYNGQTIIKNNGLIFIYNFGENSTLKSVRMNILSWSKKNSLMKILKITTGYIGRYSKSLLSKLDFNINKTNVEDELRFGISSNTGYVEIFDKDQIIYTLYEKDLIFKNIQLSITVDGIQQGLFFISEKNSEKGSDIWTFDFIDSLKSLYDVKRPMMAVESRSVKEIVDYIISGLGIETSWEISAKEYCESIIIPNSYFVANQTLYDLLLKCCQIGLLRMYIDRDNICKITRGV